MVEGGMPAIETINAATVKAARLLNIEDKLGSLDEGKLADIVAVAGNPLEDINQMGHMVLVIKEGEVVKHQR